MIEDEVGFFFVFLVLRAGPIAISDLIYSLQIRFGGTSIYLPCQFSTRLIKRHNGSWAIVRALLGEQFPESLATHNLQIRQIKHTMLSTVCYVHRKGQPCFLNLT